MTGKRILVTGGKGLLGSEISGRFAKDCRLVLTDREECDVTDIGSVRRFAREVRPEIVLHCAAYTAVDRAEGDREAAFALNEGGTRNVARVSREAGALLVTYGTDYVFDGTSGRPYAEEDLPRPLSVYGKSKLAAERAVAEENPEWLLIRTQWLFGAHGPNFIASILGKAAQEKPLRVVSDQIGSPTYARDLAAATRDLLEGGARGIYHFSNEGQTSFHEYARFILEEAGHRSVLVVPTTSADLPREVYPAPRPACSVLSKEKYSRATGKAPRPWKDAVREFLNTIRENRKP